ncbi:MAG: hypothetical protein J0L57_14960 [Burkholderiales bacterium]|nr:hypothetical protein [Burkholderiales bacterium]
MRVLISGSRGMLALVFGCLVACEVSGAQPTSSTYWPPATRYCLSELCLGDSLAALRKLDLRNDDGSPYDRKRLENFISAPVACSALDLTFGTPYYLQQGVKTRVSAGPVPTSRDKVPKSAYRIGYVERYFPGEYTLRHAKEAIDDARARWPGLGAAKLTDNYFHAFDDKEGVWFSARVGTLSRIESSGLENVQIALVITLAWSFYGSNSNMAQVHFDAQPECGKKPLMTPKF